jgi:hypothetical protein
MIKDFHCWALNYHHLSRDCLFYLFGWITMMEMRKLTSRNTKYGLTKLKELCDDLTRPLSLDNPSPTKAKFGNPSNVTPGIQSIASWWLSPVTK